MAYLGHDLCPSQRLVRQDTALAADQLVAAGSLQVTVRDHDGLELPVLPYAPDVLLELRLLTSS